MDPLLAALAQKLAVSVSTAVAKKARERLKDARWRRTLARKAANNAGRADLSGIVEDWLSEDATATNLIDYVNPASLQAAIDDLLPRVKERDTSLDDDDARVLTEDLVGHTLTEHLMALAPDLQVAVAEWRNQERHKQVLSAVQEAPSEENRKRLVQSVPPTVRDFVSEAYGAEPNATTLLLKAILDPDMAPCAAADQLLNGPPDWLAKAPHEVWNAFGYIVLAQKCLRDASIAFERAADAGAADRARYLARAAIVMMQEDEERVTTLLERAESLNASSPAVRLVRALRDQDEAAIVEASESLFSSDAERMWAFSARVSVHLVRGEFAAAVRLGEEWLDIAPDSAAVRIVLAQALLTRVVHGDSPDRSVDAAKAVRYALNARDMRRAWRLPSGDAVVLACRAAGLNGEHSRAVEIGTAPPHGEATPEEERDQEVLGVTCMACLAEDRIDRAEELAANIEDEFDRALLKAEIAAKRGESKDVVIGEWEKAWQIASTEEHRKMVWMGMASLGEWPLPGADEQLASIDAAERALIEGMAMHARGELEHALEVLRRRQSEHRTMALYVATVYEDMGRPDDAVASLKEGHARFHDPTFLVRIVTCWARAGDMEKAMEAARAGIAAVPAASPQMSMLRKALIEVAAELSDWRSVEQQCLALIGDGDRDPQTRWALLMALFNLGEYERAWEFFEAPPLDPRTENEALLAVDLSRRFGPRGGEGVSALLGLAERFRPSERVSAAIQMAILEVARQGELQAEIAEQLVREREAFFERFPESQLFRMIKVPEAPEELLEAITKDLRASAAAYEQVRDAVWLGRFPYGMLAAAAGRPYLQALLQRAAGCLPIRSLDSAVREQELAAARAALDGVVITEASAVRLTQLAPNLWPKLVGAFSTVLLTDLAFRDMVAARDALSMGASMFVGIDRKGKSSVSEISEEAAAALLSASAWCVASATSLTRIAWHRFQELTDSDYEQVGAWLGAVDIAIVRKLTLWSDDQPLRSLASSFGVPTFGTLALAEVLVERKKITPAEYQGLVDAAIANYGVEFKFDDARVVSNGRKANWEPGPTSFAFTRPAAWADGIARAASLRGVLGTVEAERPDRLAAWALAGFYGFARASNEDPAKRIASLLANLLIRLTIPSASLPAVLDGARRAADELDADDPWRETMRLLWGPMSKTHGMAEGARLLLGLVLPFADEDRHTALSVILT